MNNMKTTATLTEQWESVRKLVYYYAYSFSVRYSVYVSRAGLTDEDLHQEAFITFCNALKGYKADCGCAFSTYYMKALKYTFMRLCGIGNHGKGGIKALNVAVSFETPLKSKDERLLLIDVLSDSDSAEQLESIETDDWLSHLHTELEQCIKALTEGEAEVIKQKYYRQCKISGEALKVHRKALAKLRSKAVLSPLLREYRDNIIAQYGYRGGVTLLNGDISSSTEFTALKLIDMSMKTPMAHGVNDI